MSVYVHSPVTHKPKLCVWADLNVHNIDQLMKASSNSETKNLLQSILGIDNSSKGQILMDLYGHCIKFSKSHNFSKEQASAFFSIVKRTHEVCISTPFGNIEECFQFFRELVKTHGVHRPPWSLEIFNTEQIELLTNYVINSYFRHYKLYKYVFTPKVLLDLTLKYDGMAPSPPPEPAEEETDKQVTYNEVRDDKNEESPIATPEKAPSEKPDTPKDIPESEPDHSSELENIVRKAVVEQLKIMHESVEKQLEDTDKVIIEKIQSLELASGSGTPKTKKSPKASPKGKRKT